jgi:heme exporter protein D
MSYVYAGYGITLVSLAAYALRVVTRERSLRRRVER